MESFISQLTETDKIDIKLSLSKFLCFKLVKKPILFSIAIFLLFFYINFHILYFICFPMKYNVYILINFGEKKKDFELT